MSTITERNYRYNATLQPGRKESVVSKTVHTRQFVKPETSKIIYDCCCNVLQLSGLILTSCIIVALICCIITSVVYGSYKLVMIGITETKESTQFTGYNIETHCICITEYKHSTLIVYECELFNSSFCIESYDTNNTYTFELEQTYIYNQYDINYTIPCWTNTQCDNIYLNQSHIPIISNNFDSGTVYGILITALAAVILICCCMVGCGVSVIYLSNKKYQFIMNKIVTKYVSLIEKLYACCRKIRGIDEKEYYYSAWNNLTIEHKYDYIIGYYGRKYKFYLGNDVYLLLMEYLKKFDGEDGKMKYFTVHHGIWQRSDEDSTTTSTELILSSDDFNGSSSTYSNESDDGNGSAIDDSTSTSGDQSILMIRSLRMF